MSVREAPVVLFLREGFSVPEAGMDFQSIVADPSIVLKKER